MTSSISVNKWQKNVRRARINSGFFLIICHFDEYYMLVVCTEFCAPSFSKSWIRLWKLPLDISVSFNPNSLELLFRLFTLSTIATTAGSSVTVFLTSSPYTTQRYCRMDHTHNIHIYGRLKDSCNYEYCVLSVVTTSWCEVVIMITAQGRRKLIQVHQAI